MKKLFVLLVMVAMIAPSSVLRAQDVYRNGYVGLTVGPAYMTGELKGYKDYFETLGFGFSINAGYLLWPNIGVSASIFGTSFATKASTNDNTLGLMGFLVGPLFSTATRNEKVEFDFRPTIGFARGSATAGTQSASTKSSTIAFGAGASIRWNAWSRVSLSFNVDYYYGKPKDDSSQRVEMDLSSVGASVGANFRF